MKNDAAVLETMQVELGPRMAHAVHALAQQGYLGSTPEQVIEHCLRQYLFEQSVGVTAKAVPGQRSGC